MWLRLERVEGYLALRPAFFFIEAQCKTTTARVKGSGKRWDADNAEALMALACLDNSRLWANCWLTPDPSTN